MRTQLKFDELNRLGGGKKPIPYREFFGNMHISVAQMKRRIEIAEAFEDAMLYVFAYWLIRDDLGLSVTDMKKITRERLNAVYERYTKSDEYLDKHLNDLVNDIIDVTAKHTAVSKDGEPDTKTESDVGYWTSLDRAQIISENEANAFENYNEYRQARTGGRLHKTWLTENDERVRETHTLVEGKTVDVDGLFLVGESLMRFPMDTMYDPDPSEVINCRCACVYEP